MADNSISPPPIRDNVLLPTNKFTQQWQSWLNDLGRSVAGVEVGKEPLITVGGVGDYWRGDKTWQNFNTAARGAVSNSAPITYNSGTGVFGITQAGVSTDGYVNSTDWNIFNNKVPTTRTISTTAPLTGGGDLSADRTFAIPRATIYVNGYLHYTDFRVFLNAAKPRSVFLPVLDPDTTYGERQVRRVGTSDSYNFNFKIPYDFGSLIAAYLIGFVTSGADGSGKDIDFYTNYTLEPGDLYNEYHTSDTASTYDFTGMADRRVDIKISSLFDPIKPNAEGGLLVVHNGIGGVICYLGIWIIYDI